MAPLAMAVLTHRPTTKGVFMGLLRGRMSHDMERYGLAPGTREEYIAAIQRMATFFGRSPAVFCPDDIRDWESERDLSARVRNFRPSPSDPRPAVC